MTETANTKALVLFSGGQDSTVCLAWALARYGHVELECRETLREQLSALFPGWAAKLGPDHMLSLPELGRISDTALTRDVEIEMGENGLPTTFVPGRNLLFFTYAAALGYRRGAQVLVGGMCETDYSGYPDCRADTIAALEQAISLGMDKPFTLATPLMRIDKAATRKLAEELGGKALVDLIVEESHSCYRGDRSKRHDWGYGCGACPACELRARGYATYISGEA